MRTRVAIVVCLLFVAVLALALPAVAQDDGASAENDSVDNVTVGQSVSGFMQSTEASAQSDVNQGVYEERYEAANESERATLVDERTGDLESDLRAAEQRVERLKEQRDEMNPTAYRAQMSAAAAQLRALQSNANETERHATASGVDASRLETLRNRASELSGQEVAQIARSLAGADPAPANRTGPPENPGQGNGQGPPDDTPGDSGNGPPEDPGGDGQDADTGNGTDTDDEAGTGNGDESVGTGNGDEGTGDGDEGAGTGGGDRGTGTGGQGTGATILTVVDFT